MIEARHLSLGYSGKPLISDLSFNFSDPSFLAIVGLNGSGKSTLLKTLLNRHDFQGEIFLKGMSVKAIKSSLSEIISILPQSSFLNFPVKVQDLVIMGRFRFKQFFESYNESDYHAVEKALQNCGILHLKNSDFTTLSGGEKQLVWLAQLLVQDSPIWLLDEPTQHLDLYNKKRFFLLLKEHLKNQKKTIFCVTHDLSYLHLFEGQYILNLSEKNPKVKPIHTGSLKAVIEFLEENTTK